MVHKEREGELLIATLQIMLSVTYICHLGSKKREIIPDEL